MGEKTDMKVLVVDDEPLVVWSIVKAIGTLNHSVDWAFCGKEAMRKTEKNRYDLVVADYKLPDATGKEVIEKIKQNYPGVGVILVTAYRNETGVKEIEDKKLADVVFEKPFNLDELIAFIKEVDKK